MEFYFNMNYIHGMYESNDRNLAIIQKRNAVFPIEIGLLKIEPNRYAGLI